MPATSQNADYVLDTSALARRKQTQFNFRPDAAQMRTLKEALDLSSLRKLSFSGNLSPVGKNDWLLVAELGATAVQPCAITLEPVTTRIDEHLERRFVAEMPDFSKEVEEDEFGGVAMIEDDSLEPLESEIDLWRVMSEALALALPDYPRADGAELGTLTVTEPGKEALTEDSAKPFAGLADLMAKPKDEL